MAAADAEGAARCGEFPEAQTTTEEVPVRAKGKTPKPTAVAEDQKHKSLSIEWWPIDRPKPYERNARRIPQSAIDKVAASIKEFGWRQSLVVDKKDVLIAGHARLLAARQLGLKSVPVHVADNLSPEQVKQYRLMDNRSHEALWDVEKLNLELIDLKDLDLNLTGFDSHEISSLTDIESFPWLYQTEHVKIGELRAHPKNFRIHPEDQIEHIIESVRKNGLYRTVVVAADGTILAGHGIVAAYRKMGRKSIEVVRLSVEPDSIEAMKVLIGDNDISGRGKQDDRALAEILKEIKGRGGDLLGTGYTDELLRDLLRVTSIAGRGQVENDPLEHWEGMPDYESENAFGKYRLVVHIRNDEDLQEFARITGNSITAKTRFIWFPREENAHLDAFKYVGGEE